MNWTILLVGGLMFTYTLIHKPEYIAVLLFTLIIANINFDLKSLPLNSRALITLALFGRVLLDKPTQSNYPPFLGVASVKILILFLSYTLFIAFSQGIFKVDLFKEHAQVILSAYCVYHFYFKQYNAKQLKAAMILSGLICFADLAYTYIIFGTFPVHRIYYQITGAVFTDDELIERANWNFFGQICGMCFVFILCDFIKNKVTNGYSLLLLPVMFGGVLMSTSRSSLLAVLIISILLLLNGIKYKDQKKKIYRVSVFLIGWAVAGLLVFATFSKLLNLDNDFRDELINRLSREPIAIVNKALGQSYNIQDLGSMDWRGESSENAYAAYMNLSFPEQVFGIGVGGFELRNIGKGFNAHNAALLLLIESGLVGFTLFFTLIVGTILRSIIVQNISPSLAAVGFTLIYGMGQNKEWTSVTNYLFVFCIVAEIQYLKNHRPSNSFNLNTSEQIHQENT